MHLNFFVWLCRQVINIIHTAFCQLHDFDHVKSVFSIRHILYSLNTLQYTSLKFRPQTIWFVIFCAPLYRDYLSDLHKKFQVASECDAHVQSEVFSFWCNFFYCADNPYINTHAHADKLLKMRFSNLGHLFGNRN